MLLPPVTSEHITRIIRRLLTFPNATICRHAVICDLISAMESQGWNPPNEFVDAVVNADDSIALKYLEAL